MPKFSRNSAISARSAAKDGLPRSAHSRLLHGQAYNFVQGKNLLSAKMYTNAAAIIRKLSESHAPRACAN